MDLDEAVSTPPESGDTDIALVTYCASLLHVSPTKLLKFVLEAVPA